VKRWPAPPAAAASPPQARQCPGRPIYQNFPFLPSEPGEAHSLEFVLSALDRHCDRFSLDVSRHVILVSIKESPREKVLALASGAISSKALTSSEAGSLYGTCRWVLCYGCFGVCALYAIEVCQYDSRPHSVKGALAWRLSEELK